MKQTKPTVHTVDLGLEGTLQLWITALLTVCACTQGSPEPVPTEQQPNALAQDKAISSATPSVLPPTADNGPAAPPGVERAHCELSNNDGSGGQTLTEVACMVRDDGMGSGGFSITGINDTDILENISLVSVTVIGTRRAEVRGLTTFGINSRWGMAKQSRSAPDCWKGSDFEICVRAPL